MSEGIYVFTALATEAGMDFCKAKRVEGDYRNQKSSQGIFGGVKTYIPSLSFLHPLFFQLLQQIALFSGEILWSLDIHRYQYIPSSAFLKIWNTHSLHPEYRA